VRCTTATISLCVTTSASTVFERSRPKKWPLPG
jgi:hypothetical protein